MWCNACDTNVCVSMSLNELCDSCCDAVSIFVCLVLVRTIFSEDLVLNHFREILNVNRVGFFSVMWVLRLLGDNTSLLSNHHIMLISGCWFNTVGADKHCPVFTWVLVWGLSRFTPIQHLVSAAWRWSNILNALLQLNSGPQEKLHAEGRGCQKYLNLNLTRYSAG